ncbi:synaptopodin isoform X2 [Pristis pectinata]|uniref:synaptopodin isoform X2 n=1 Tax=Pristis pectinata TaxID=685728 RepID=UPI00223DA248|nr:synaptopodin isoform X2 [Pristis pectinata]
MQVEADVHSCGYIRQEPKTGWSLEGADSPPSDARIWEVVAAQEVGQVDVEEKWPSDNIFGCSATGPTVSKVVTGQVTSIPEGRTRSISCSLEVGEEKCSRLRSMDRGGSHSGRTAPQQTPASLRRSRSSSEQEARGARLQSHKIAAQLTTGTPPGPNSKGVLLFNRRKERVNELALSGPLDGGTGARVAEEAGVPYFEQQAGMEEEEVDEEAAGTENRRPEAGPEAPAPGLGGPPAEAYLELQAEARREAGTSVLARPPLPPPPPLSKTGILEQSRLRKAGRRPMFTFHERPRLAPNPELLSLVHGADVQRKAGGGGGGGGGGGDEGLALGAEACTLGQAKAPAPAPAPGPAISAGEERPAPEWASCLKPPELRPPHRPGALQGLAEVRGKGAELFARRQTRMERYTLEAPAPPPRPPSPTASLPAGWKCSGSGGWVRPEASAYNGKAAALPGRRQVSSASLVISPPARSPPPPSGPLVAKLSSPLPPPVAARPQGPRLNGFAAGEGRGPDSQPAQASPGHAPAPPATPRPAEATQAPRPTFSARRAGLEAQGWTSPVTPPWKTAIDRRMSIPRTYLDTIPSDPASDAAPHSPRTPPCPLSPSAGVLSPNSWTPPREPKSVPAGKPGSEVAESRRLKDLLAKNVVIAARRKKLSSPTGSPSSPGEPPFPLSPRSDCLSPLSPHTPSPAVYVRSPLRMYRRSLTDSEFSLGSDDSGARSPSYHNFCPRGWTGSRAKQSEQ